MDDTIDTPYELAFYSFQMIPVFEPYYYGVSAEESYTNISGGTPNPPQIPGIPNNTISGDPSALIQVINDILIGARYPILEKVTPYSQTAIIEYQTTYENLPQINAEKNVLVTNMTIINNSTNNALINYAVLINGPGASVESLASAAPGTIVKIQLPSKLIIHNNNEGIDIKILAFTGCTGPCIQSPYRTDFRGFMTFNFNP